MIYDVWSKKFLSHLIYTAYLVQELKIATKRYYCWRKCGIYSQKRPDYTYFVHPKRNKCIIGIDRSV